MSIIVVSNRDPTLLVTSEADEGTTYERMNQVRGYRITLIVVLTYLDSLYTTNKAF